MGSEPTSIMVVLGAWVLNHAPSNKGVHNAADDCTYVISRDCTFSVAIAAKDNPADTDFSDVTVADLPADPNNPFLPSTAATVPLAAVPAILRVKATPTKKITIKSAHGKTDSDGHLHIVQDQSTEDGFFEGTAFFKYEGKGVWTRLVRSPEEEEEDGGAQFAPPSSVTASAVVPVSAVMISFFLSRVRDRTIKALKVLQSADSSLKEFFPQSTDYKRLKDPPVDKGRVVFETKPLNVDTEFRVLEVKGFKAPALLAVAWPRKNNTQSPTTPTPPGFRAAPMEALIFFHASFAQNAQIYNLTPYPFGLQQMSHGFESYLGPSDPLEEAYPLSLPFQIAAAGKQATLIIPLNRVAFPELANLNFGEQAVETLEEMHAALLRVGGFYHWTPQIGRLAIASFSAGIQELLVFKQAAVQQKLLSALLQEIYIFDPVHDSAATVMNYASGLKAWASNVQQRRVRVYNNAAGPSHPGFVGKNTLPTPPFVADSNDKRFTTGVVTDADWLNANEGFARFRYVRRADLRSARLKKAVAPGDTKVSLTPPNPFHAGDLIVIGTDRVATGISAYKVSRVAGNDVIVDPPILHAVVQEDMVFRFGPANFATTLAADASKGSKTVTLAAVESLSEEDRVMISDAEFNVVATVKGNDVELVLPLQQDRPQGESFHRYEPLVFTRLSGDAPAQSTTINVYGGKSSTFAKGDMIGIGKSEFIKATNIGDTSIELAQPLQNDHKKDEQVAKLGPRSLDWGIYHAMFVSVFITDAMRKSGFR